MATSASLNSAILGFACLAGALWYGGRRAEVGVEVAQKAAGALAPLQAGEADSLAALNELGAALGAEGSSLQLGAGIDPREGSILPAAEDEAPRRARSGPWPEWVDAEPEVTPRTLRVQLVDGASALQALTRVRVVQRSGGETAEGRAYRLSEDDPTLWGIGSPGLLTGIPAHFEVRAEAHGRSLQGEFHLDAVPPGGNVEVEVAVALVESAIEGPAAADHSNR